MTELDPDVEPEAVEWLSQLEDGRTVHLRTRDGRTATVSRTGRSGLWQLDRDGHREVITELADTLLSLWMHGYRER